MPGPAGTLGASYIGRSENGVAIQSSPSSTVTTPIVVSESGNYFVSLSLPVGTENPGTAQCTITVDSGGAIRVDGNLSPLGSINTSGVIWADAGSVVTTICTAMTGSGWVASLNGALTLIPLGDVSVFQQLP